MSSPRLTCGPVQLRLVTPRSAGQMYQLARDPELSRFLSWKPHESVEDTLSFIEDTHRLWRRRVAFLPGVFDHSTQRLVGAIGVSSIDRANHRAEVGTWIGIPYQGRGFNLPAKAAMLRFCFAVLGLHRVELVVHVANEQSIAAVAKLPGVLDEGLQHKRLFRGPTAADARMFAITSDTYDPRDYPSVRVEGPAF